MDSLRRLIIAILFALLIFPSTIKANNNNYASVVNIVRVAPYTNNLSENIQEQIKTLNKNDLKATWLLTYDALNDEKSIKILSERKNDEFGLWLEINQSITDKLDIDYNDKLAWHYANQVFLSAYTQEERIALIDEYFEKFSLVFGRYPTAVGSWWTDSFSLQYMKEKYNVKINLAVADQYSTDHYQVWGQHWSTPYIVNSNHSAIPSYNTEGVVNVQWAPRDPLNGYFNSLYSFQDYKVYPLDYTTEYFEKLANFYLSNEYGINYITVGLESDLPDKTAYSESSEYFNQTNYISRNEDIKPTTLTEFADLYKPSDNQFSILHADDFGDKEIYWIQNSFYRAGVRIDEKNKNIEIFDLRFYDHDFKDPYFYSANSDLNLSIYVPSIIDQFQDDFVWLIPYREIGVNEFDNKLSITSEEFFIEFTDQNIIYSDSLTIPDRVKKHPQLNINKNTITINDNAYSDHSYYIRGLSDEFRYSLKSKKYILLYTLTIIFGIGFLTFLIYIRKFKILSLAIFVIIFSFFAFFQFVTKEYYVSQSELDTLYKLKSLDPGRILVYDQDCLQCDYHTPKKPAVFANIKQYIKDITGNQLYLSNQFPNISREDAKSYLSENNIKYIYLVGYEDYKQIIPHQPGDIGARRIYSNANTQLWEFLE